MKKDLKIEFRTKHTLSFMFLFSLLTVIMFSVAVGFPAEVTPEVGAGLLWLVILFTGVLGVTRAYGREKESGTLDGIKLTPVGLSSVLVAKILYNFVLMFLVVMIVFPPFVIFLGYSVKGSIPLAFLILALGAASFAVVGSALATLVLHAKAREMLLPVMLMPIIFPDVSAAVSALRKVSNGLPTEAIVGEITIMTVYIVIMLTISLMTADFALEN